MKSSLILTFIALISVSCEKQTDQIDIPSLKNSQSYILSKSRKINILEFDEVPMVVTRDLTIYNRTKEPFWVFGESLEEVRVQVLRRETEDKPWDGRVLWCGTGCDFFRVDPDKSFLVRITLPEDMSHWQFYVEYTRYSQKDRICEVWSTERTPIMTMDSNILTEQDAPPKH